MTSWRLVSDVPRATNNPPTHCLNTPKGNHTPQRTGNTTDDLSLSHMHVQKGGLPINILFFDHIMEADIPLGWKPLNLEQYDGTTNLHEHLDAFLTQGAALTWYDGLPPRSIDSFNTLIERFSAQYATSRFHRITSDALANLRQADNESLRKFRDRLSAQSSRSKILTPR
ncbi:hypothetical protein JHK85_010057 [Glycine max]|nr:hypothetical protein JHK85_010057 [Glycine max]